MRSPKSRIRLLAAGALALLLTTGAARQSSADAVLSSAGAQPPPAAGAPQPSSAGSSTNTRETVALRVTGAGGGILGPEWGPYAGDPVRLELDGRATDPMRPSGSFHVVHRKPDGRLLAEFSGRVTSLTAVDEVAVVTGVIDVAEHPDVPLQFVGKPVAFTVYDGGAEDRIGWVWGFFGAPVSPLQGTAPVFPLTEGGFRVDGGPRHHGAQGNDPAVPVKAATDGTTVAAVLGGPSPSARTGSPSLGAGSMRFELAARVPPGGDPTQVQGRFHFTERGVSGVDVEGRLTCLVAGGPVAVTTGVVTKSSDPAKIGKPVSFSLKDGTIDRLGWLFSWSAARPAIADCMSTVPFYAPRWGGLVVPR